MLDIKITRATETQIPQLMEIWKWFMDYHASIQPRFARREDGHINFGKWLRELLDKSDNNLVLVALDKEKVIGYAIAQVHVFPPVIKYDKVGFISDLAVLPQYQRQGIGEKLFDKAQQWFDARGLDKIELRIATGNETGAAFWNKHGFREISKTLSLDRKR